MVLFHLLKLGFLKKFSRECFAVEIVREALCAHKIKRPVANQLAFRVFQSSREVNYFAFAFSKLLKIIFI